MAKLSLATYESTTRAGVIYELSYDDHKKTTNCSCPGARYHGHCKHVDMLRLGLYPKSHVVLTLIGAIKYPHLNSIYKVL